jgi:hypothetical protein
MFYNTLKTLIYDFIVEVYFIKWHNIAIFVANVLPNN